MRKYISQFPAAILSSALLLSALPSCTAVMGTEPGTDPEPVITIYQYEPSAPYNPDNDVLIRFVCNSATTQGYYLVEKEDEKESRLASGGEEGYINYVLSNGTRLNDIPGEDSYEDVVVTDLLGSYSITAVAVGESGSTLSSDIFQGLEWDEENEVWGTYYYVGAPIVVTNNNLEPTRLPFQRCISDSNIFRIKDAMGEGYPLKITGIDQWGEDENGVGYQYARIEPQNTGFTHTYNGTYYGALYVRDLGYYWGNDAYITSYGYENRIFDDGRCEFCLQWYVAAGAAAWGWDYFYPDEY